MSEVIVVGDLRFALQRSARRKTVGLTIERDGALVLRAPADCPTAVLERVARGKQLWVYKKLAEKEMLAQPAAEKEFVTGAGFYYLGRSYRLLLVEPGQTVPALRLHLGRFMLRRDECHRGQEHCTAWYTSHGQPWLQGRVDRFAARIEVAPQAVVIQDLGFRWGACAPGGVIYFHWRAILLPPPIIEYIVAHELVHLREPHHDAAFWQRLERTVPDYAARKQWLAEHGGRFC